jgi:sugar lactone lactonase YvrE
MIGKYGSFIVIFLLVVLACPPVLASEVGEYELVATWGSLGADDGRFNYPAGIAVDGEGNVYVADTGNNRIQKFDSTGAFLLKWGSEGSGDGEFYSPQDIALDADGNVYVVDGSRIQVFDSSGTFIRKWGSYGTGEEQLQYPRSIAFDADGNAYVIAGSVIKKFDSDGSFLTAWGALGTYDGEFNNPTDVAVDGAGNVYIADCYNNRIQKFDDTGTFLLKWASQGYGEGQLQQPNGLAIDADGNIYVATWDRPVQKFDGSGSLLAKGTDTFYDSRDIVVGADGTIYVTNSRDDCVRVFKQSSAPTPTPTVPKAPSITSNKDIVVRGNSFVVTITGELSKDYHLFIEEVDGLGSDKYPVIMPGQVGVYYAAHTDYPTRNVSVVTNAAGIRSVQFNTNRSTAARTFTVRVEDPADPTIYDDVRVKVEEGTVTITTHEIGYLGGVIWLEGTNTDSDTVYLLLTGPNLPSGGVRLDGEMSPVEDNNTSSFATTGVRADDTWLYKWDTAAIQRPLKAGSYTVYAAAEPRNRDNLSGVKYAAADIQLRLPSIKVSGFSDTVAPGDDLVINGFVTGSLYPDSIRIWIIGPDYLSLGVPIVLRTEHYSTNSFMYHLTGAETSNFTMGQYFVVIQHPVTNGFGVTANGTTISGPDITPTDLADLDPPEAANALIGALESPRVDDAYAKLAFTVGAPMIRIDRIERAGWIGWVGCFDGPNACICGETFTVTGTTGYPADTTLSYTIASQENEANTLSGDVIVTGGGAWILDVNTTSIEPGWYTIRITSLDGQSSASASFVVRDGVINPIPPAGAIYQVERISVAPYGVRPGKSGNLVPGEQAVIEGSINAPWAGCREDLGFSTDLLDPAWSYAVVVEQEVIRSGSQSTGSFTLSAFELDYGEEDTRVLLQLSGTVPQEIENPALIRVFQRDRDGRTVPDSEYHLSLPLAGDDPAPPFTDNLTLSSGWNFVSVPRALSPGDDTATIFAAIDTDGHSAFRYDTVNRNWIALQETDQIRPLEGYWIYSTGPATVPLTFSTDPLVSPPERTLSTGWNAVGVTGTAPATARDALYSVNAQWTTLIGFNAQTQGFETGIVNGGTGGNADTRSVYPGRGYWLHMTGPGTLGAIGA